MGGQSMGEDPIQQGKMSIPGIGGVIFDRAFGDEPATITVTPRPETQVQVGARRAIPVTFELADVSDPWNNKADAVLSDLREIFSNEDRAELFRKLSAHYPNEIRLVDSDSHLGGT